MSRSIKLAAKKGDTDSAKILAKEVVNARKSVAKIYTAKANLGSIEMQIKQQVRAFWIYTWFDVIQGITFKIVIKTIITKTLVS